MPDKKNQEGLPYWEDSWNTRGIQCFSPHTTWIEKTKWEHLQKDLKGYSGRSLEVGSGSGHFSALLAEAGFNAILLDYSFSAIACARRSFSSLDGRDRKKYVLGNAFALPVRDSSMDVVISCGLLEHFEEPSGVVREMVRVLREGGLFYADICPKKLSLIGMLDFLYPKPEGWYEAKINKRQIIKTLSNLGLENIQVFGAGILPPRNIPGKGRIKILGAFERLLIRRFSDFWLRMDGKRLADWMGLYYYASGTKPRNHQVNYASS
jgi:ubiquinone/menaquinone biosynthesis C-methylase UbiE